MGGLKNVWGGFVVTSQGEFSTQEALDKAYDILDDGDCSTIDTATMYPGSEEHLGKFGAPKRVTIDTKTIGGFQPGHASKEAVIADAENSIKLLGVKQVDIWYIHAPDDTVPIENTLEGINEVYKRGFFKRFGLSNYKAEDVRKIYDICKAKGYPLPSVYQGNYSPVARKQEEILFPTLRELNIAFYVYSPLAGGFLTKTKQSVLEGQGRFDPNTTLGAIYSGMYNKPALLEALAEWEAIAKEEDVSRAELAYRWVKYNSPLKAEHGDAMIFGARTIEQLKDTLHNLKKGPLSENAAKRIDQVWEKIKDEAPLDNFHK